MARADLLLELVRAGARGDQVLFRKTVEALAAEERAKQHHVLADRLAGHLQANGKTFEPPVPMATRTVGLPEPFVEVVPRKRISDLILDHTIRSVCAELVEEHQRRDLLRSYNLEPRHRVLLAGPPGNGKTSLAEALACELAVPLLVVRYESVITSYLGETAIRLAKLFENVRQRRCVVLFDEFDAVGKERGDTHEIGEIKRLVSSLLLQVDALPSHVLIVAATNHAELLDRAVWRRFQVRLELAAPTMPQLAEWIERLPTFLELRMDGLKPTLQKTLAGLSFAELEEFAFDVRRRQVLANVGSNGVQILRDRARALRQRPTMLAGRKPPSK